MIENALRDKDPGLSLMTEGTVTYWILRLDCAQPGASWHNFMTTSTFSLPSKLY